MKFDKGDRIRLTKPFFSGIGYFPMPASKCGKVQGILQEPECEDHYSVLMDGMSHFCCVPVSALEKG